MNEFKCQALEQQSSGRKQEKRKRERGNGKERKLRRGVVLDLAFQFILLSAAFCGFARCNCGSGWDAEGRKRELLEQTFQLWSIYICMGGISGIQF